MSESGADSTEERFAVLRVPSFRTLWFANCSRGVAAEVAAFCLPITAVTVLGSGPLAMSAISVATRLGSVLTGLPAGVWVDRWPKRRVMIVADAAYLLAFGSIPVVYLLGLLDVVQMVLVAFVTSIAEVFFDVAHTSVLPHMLPKRAISDASARLQTSDNTIKAVSPGTSGALTALLPPPILYLFAAVGHLCSLVLVGRIPPENDSPAPPSGRDFRHEILDGLRMLVGHPLLRLLVTQAALVNLGAGVLLSQLPLFLLRDLGISAWVFGLLSTLGALTGIAASLLAPRARQRFGEIRMTLVFTAAAPLAMIAMPLAGLLRPVAVPLAALSEALIGFVVVGRLVSATGLRARVTPTRYLGRVTAANSVVTQAATPLGAVIGGAVAETSTASTALWVGVSVMASAPVALLLFPIAREKRLPPAWEVDS